MNTVLLKAEGLGKSFSSVAVLNDISLEVRPGEILGLIGENGAGKSTFMKILAGIHEPTTGHLTFAGRVATLRTPKDAKDLGISLVPQEFNLVDDLSVFENVFLGSELLLPHGLLDRAAMVARTRELLAELESDLDPTRAIPTLSVAQKQLVEIAKAIKVDCRLLIMDEPTTVLSAHEIDVLFRIMARLKARGTAIIYISHKLAEVKAICDRVMILRDGNFVCLEDAATLSVHEMARRMVGRELNQLFQPKSADRGAVVLELRELAVPGVLKDVSLTLHRGEILGLAGLMGAGRTEVAETILGLRTPTHGAMLWEGKPVRFANPREACDAGIAYVSEDRQGTGILTDFTMAQNVTLVSLWDYSHPLIDVRAEAAKAEFYIGEFGIRPPSPQTRLEHLSGGNQQKVSLAKSLDTAPQVLIIDEPTRGVDVKAKGDIYSFLRNLADKGLAILLISSELEEVIGLCSRVIVMREGRTEGELSGSRVNQEEIISIATGIQGAHP